MRYICEHCKGQVSDDQNYCHHCGSIFDVSMASLKRKVSPEEKDRQKKVLEEQDNDNRRAKAQAKSLKSKPGHKRAPSPAATLKVTPAKSGPFKTQEITDLYNDLISYYKEWVKEDKFFNPNIKPPERENWLGMSGVRIEISSAHKHIFDSTYKKPLPVEVPGTIKKYKKKAEELLQKHPQLLRRVILRGTEKKSGVYIPYTGFYTHADVRKYSKEIRSDLIKMGNQFKKVR